MLKACAKGHTNEVTDIIAGGGVDVDATDGRDASSLFLASKKGHTAVVDLLLQAGANIDKADKHGRTPLLVACVEGHLEVATMLVDRGADVDATDKRGRTALMLVSRGKKHGEVANMLVQRIFMNENEDPLHQKCVNQADDPNEIRDILYGKDVEVNAVATKGSKVTPLHVASILGRVKVGEALLMADADKEKGDVNDETSLYYACKYGQDKMVKALVKAGANHNTENKDGMTLLWIACSAGHTKVVKYLLKDKQIIMDRTKGVSKHLDEIGGWPPLWIACRHKHMFVVHALLDAGVFERNPDTMPADVRSYYKRTKALKVVAKYASPVMKALKAQFAPCLPSCTSCC